MNVPTQVISAETPGGGPEHRARDVIRSEGPPRHPQNPGDDAIQLSQAVEKAGQQNNYSAAALEKINEVLLSLGVDLEFNKYHSTAPATDGVADAITDRGRRCYEKQEQRDVHPSRQRPPGRPP